MLGVEVKSFRNVPYGAVADPRYRHDDLFEYRDGLPEHNLIINYGMKGPLLWRKELTDWRHDLVVDGERRKEEQQEVWAQETEDVLFED